MCRCARSRKNVAPSAGPSGRAVAAGGRFICSTTKTPSARGEAYLRRLASGMSASLACFSSPHLSLSVSGTDGVLAGTNALRAFDSGHTLWWVDSQDVECLDPSSGRTIAQTVVLTAGCGCQDERGRTVRTRMMNCLNSLTKSRRNCSVVLSVTSPSSVTKPGVNWM
jgi:hypothetical protein